MCYVSSEERDMKRLIEGVGYKYLSIIKADQVQYTEMKEEVTAEYLRRVCKVLKAKLNGVNITKEINT